LQQSPHMPAAYAQILAGLALRNLFPAGFL
jgi:hypothetical protein